MHLAKTSSFIQLVFELEGVKNFEFLSIILQPKSAKTGGLALTAQFNFFFFKTACMLFKLDLYKTSLLFGVEFGNFILVSRLAQTVLFQQSIRYK